MGLYLGILPASDEGVLLGKLVTSLKNSFDGAGMRFNDIATYHITLRHLGYTGYWYKKQMVRLKLRKHQISKFLIGTGELRLLGPVENPHTLALTIGGGAEAIRECVYKIGNSLGKSFPEGREQRPFIPHISVASLRGIGSGQEALNLQQQVRVLNQSLEKVRPVQIRVDTIHLLEQDDKGLRSISTFPLR